MTILDDGINVMGSGVAPEPPTPPEPEEPVVQTASVPKPDTIDPTNYTVAQVQAYLAEHPEDTDAVLAAERAGKNRATLVNTEEN